MTKSILKFVASFILISIFACSVSAEEGVSWYVKRSGNARPAIDENQRIIEKYNGYYIDKNVSDTSAEKIIYLTFDAGYENGNVEKIMDTLKEKNVPAAFFVLDNIIIKNTDLIKRMEAEGHTVCNHTRNHKDLTKCTDEEIKSNVLRLEEIYKEKTGYDMAKYFRFPEGKYSERSLKVISDLGYKTIFWSFAYADWDNDNQPPLDTSIKKILDNTHNGEVILLHPNSETNAKILPTLIDKWREMGYEFGTLDRLTRA